MRKHGGVPGRPAAVTSSFLPQHIQAPWELSAYTIRTTNVGLSRTVSINPVRYIIEKRRRWIKVWREQYSLNKAADGARLWSLRSSVRAGARPWCPSHVSKAQRWPKERCVPGGGTNALTRKRFCRLSDLEPFSVWQWPWFVVLVNYRHFNFGKSHIWRCNTCKARLKTERLWLWRRLPG